jgi:hypothetical protein
MTATVSAFNGQNFRKISDHLERYDLKYEAMAHTELVGLTNLCHDCEKAGGLCGPCREDAYYTNDITPSIFDENHLSLVHALEATLQRPDEEYYLTPDEDEPIDHDLVNWYTEQKEKEKVAFINYTRKTRRIYKK